MNKLFKSFFLIVSVLCAGIASAQTYELFPYADFEHWTVRHIKESKIVGGNVRTLYVPGPTDTIDRNEAFNYSKTRWCTSNAYAVVAGITKTSTNVTPDRGQTGTCAKLETKYASCKVAGMINIKVLAAGSVYLGDFIEPIKGVSDPYANMDWGIPFTKRPKAFVMDYKAKIQNSGTLTKGTTMRHTTFAGYDPSEVVVILQNRWEDEKGNIHAKRVGTAIYRIDKSTNGWKTNFTMPIIYGDRSVYPQYEEYMGLRSSGYTQLYARNSKGKIVPIHEDEWGKPDTPVTHLIVSVTSGSCGAYIGELGNILWIDNLRLEY